MKKILLFIIKLNDSDLKNLFYIKRLNKFES